MSPEVRHQAEAFHQEIVRLIHAHDFAAAELACNRLTAGFPQFHPAWRSASFIALRLGKLADATRMIEHALLDSPHDPHDLLQYARCLSAQRRIPESLERALAAERGAAQDPGLLDAIGSFYHSVEQHQQAERVYSRAVEIDPAQPLYRFNRAATRRFLGQIAAAEEDYDQVIRLRPDDCEAYANRSELRKQTPGRNHVAAMEQLLARGVPDPRARVQLHYALAKELEDLEQYPRSWEHLAGGAALRRRHLRYDVRQDLDTVDWIIQAYPQAQTAPPAEDCGNGPIFVVGLPRSGTTLVERILGSHSQVFAAGELNDFTAALMQAVRHRAGDRLLSRSELIATSRTVDFAALGADYLERTRPASGHRRRFVDKMPLNYLYCGLIRRALPNARIVHVTRHPMASCYAMYKTLFRDGYPFSYDLDETARYYMGYRRLMRHWRQSMPGFIHEVRYERIVTDFEAECRRLLAACGLEWQDGCLEFHRNPASTTTASASQVRRPLYDSSLQQWRHYERQLEPLRARLRAEGIESAELDV